MTAHNLSHGDRETAVLKVERERSRLLLEQQTDALDELLRPDFIAVHITGYEQTKAEWLAQIRSGQMAYHEVQELSAAVTLGSDNTTAVVVTKNLVTATIYGARGTWPLESTTTYIYDGGAWKGIHSTATTF